MISLISPFLQFLPLSAFASYAYADVAPTPRRWLEAFAIGSALALTRLVFMRRRNIDVNPLILGTDLYLVFGLVACLSGHLRLTGALASLQATGFFVAILVIGVASTIWSTRGFVSAKSSDRTTVIKASVVLLIITLGATVVSYYFRGNTSYSGVLPIITVALSQRLLRWRLERSG